MSRDQHYSNISAHSDVSDDLTNIKGNFMQIMNALEAQAGKTFGVWDGAGEDEARVNNSEFRSYYDEVDQAFDHLIRTHEEVNAELSFMHSRVTKTFER